MDGIVENNLTEDIEEESDGELPEADEDVEDALPYMAALGKTVQYEITYDIVGTIPEGAKGLATPSAILATPGEVIDVEEVPSEYDEIEGYIFYGWDTEDVLVDEGTFEMPDYDVSFTGEWVKDNTEKYYWDFTDPDSYDGNKVKSWTGNGYIQNDLTYSKAGDLKYTAENGFDNNQDGTLNLKGEVFFFNDDITLPYNREWTIEWCGKTQYNAGKANPYAFVFASYTNKGAIGASRDNPYLFWFPKESQLGLNVQKSGSVSATTELDIPFDNAREEVVKNNGIYKLTNRLGDDSKYHLLYEASVGGTKAESGEYPSKYDFDTTLDTLLGYHNNNGSYISYYFDGNIKYLSIEIADEAEDNHIVTFDSTGGSYVEPVSVKDGETVEEPTDPISENATFEGWFTDETLLTEADFDDPVTDDITFFAKWNTIEPVKVTYEYAGTVPAGAPATPSETVALPGSEVTVAARPAHTGYTFNGWTTSDVTVTDGKFTMPYKDVRFTGYWKAVGANDYQKFTFDDATGLEDAVYGSYEVKNGKYVGVKSVTPLKDTVTLKKDEDWTVEFTYKCDPDHKDGHEILASSKNNGKVTGETAIWILSDGEIRLTRCKNASYWWYMTDKRVIPDAFDITGEHTYRVENRSGDIHVYIDEYDCGILCKYVADSSARSGSVIPGKPDFDWTVSYIGAKCTISGLTRDWEMSGELDNLTIAAYPAEVAYDMDYEAEHTPASVRVNFHGQNLLPGETMVLASGSEIDERPGYRFKGWYVADAPETVYTETYSPKQIGTTTLKAKWEAAAGDEITLRYDDRADTSALGKATVVSEIVKSFKVGTGKAEKDAHVITVVNDGKKLIATGTGEAVVSFDNNTPTDPTDDKEYLYIVKSAPISLFMLTGHSVSAGQAGNAAQSVVCPEGQVYSTNEAGHSSKINGISDVSGYGLGYGSSKRLSGIDAATTGSGVAGEDSGFAYQWNRITATGSETYGEKVWIMNTGVGGSSLTQWKKGGGNYNYAVTSFKKAEAILKNEVEAGHFTLSHMGILNHTTANGDQSWAISDYTTAFNSMWNGFKDEFAMDIDGDGDDETAEFIALAPIYIVRSMNGSDWIANPLVMNNGKYVNYWMTASKDYPDVFMGSLLTRDWSRTDKGHKNTAENHTKPKPEVEDYFNEQYPSGLNYSTHGGSKTLPKSIDDVLIDGVHCSQLAYNEVGIDFANNINSYIEGEEAEEVSLLKEDGYTEIADNEKILLKSTESIKIGPLMEPVSSGNIRYEITGGISFTEPCTVTAVSDGDASIKVYSGTTLLKTVLFKVGEGDIKVTFDAREGTCETTTKYVTNGAAYGTLPVAKRTSYKFDGWFTEIAGGTKIEETTIATKTEDHTLYAHYTYSPVSASDYQKFTFDDATGLEDAVYGSYEVKNGKYVGVKAVTPLKDTVTLKKDEDWTVEFTYKCDPDHKDSHEILASSKNIGSVTGETAIWIQPDGEIRLTRCINSSYWWYMTDKRVIPDAFDITGEHTYRIENRSGDIHVYIDEYDCGILCKYRLASGGRNGSETPGKPDFDWTVSHIGAKCTISGLTRDWEMSGELDDLTIAAYPAEVSYDMDYEAEHTPASVRVNFHGQNLLPGEDIVLASGSEIEDRPGYAFSGWYEADAPETVYTETYSPKQIGITTLKAKWTGASSKIAVPTAVTGLVYDGTEKTGVASGAGYKLTGATASNAGDYTAVAKLEAGYKWNDDSTADKNIQWSIAKAAGAITAPTAKTLTYTGQDQELVNAGTSSTGTVKYSLSEGGSYTTSIPKGKTPDTYNVWYYSSADGNHYDTAKAKVTVTIGKGIYDMSGVSFPSRTFTYDGNAHSIELEGTLPAGVGVYYVGNGKTDVGTYTVTAKFTNSDANYSTPSDLSAVMTILNNGGSSTGGSTNSSNTLSGAYSEPSSSATTISGTWSKVGSEWHFSRGNQTASNGWYKISYADGSKSGWFCFDQNGNMRTGWVQSPNGNWYYCRETDDGNIGCMETGWHRDIHDGKTYYLDPVTGQMAIGWKLIDGKSYYFAEQSFASPWMVDPNNKWTTNGTTGRATGSMYANEMTPDGKLVGGDGALIQ